MGADQTRSTEGAVGPTDADSAALETVPPVLEPPPPVLETVPPVLEPRTPALETAPPAMKRRTLTFSVAVAMGESASAPELVEECATPPSTLRGEEAARALDAAGALDADRDVRPPRPSELSTVPSPASGGIAQDSSSDIMELSESALESDDEVGTASDGSFVVPALPRLSLALDLDEVDDVHEHLEDAPKVALALSEAPRPNDTMASVRTSTRRLAGALLLSHAVVFALGVVVKASGSSRETTLSREPNVALGERTPLVDPSAATVLPPSPGGCVVTGGSRLLASHAQIGPALDVSVLATGFGVAFASGATEAVGLRVEGSGLRIAERVRTKTGMFVSHAVVDVVGEDETDVLDVRIDDRETRSVVSGGDRPAFRVAARGGALLALLEDVHGVRTHHLWALPALRDAMPPSATNDPAGFSRLSDVSRPPSTLADRPPEVLRVAGRDDGGVVIALRRPSTFWLGVTDAWLVPTAPLVPLVRRGATVGTPAVVSWAGGGAVAWAERPANEHEWNVAVASFESDDDGRTVLGDVHAAGKGMSPTLVVTPDSELLLVYADGPSGAHRIVARRLGRDLEARGDLVVVSPPSINAGQPVAALRPDGRGIVAFFSAEGGRAASVLATPLACATGP